MGLGDIARDIAARANAVSDSVVPSSGGSFGQGNGAQRRRRTAKDPLSGALIRNTGGDLVSVGERNPTPWDVPPPSAPDEVPTPAQGDGSIDPGTLNPAGASEADAGRSQDAVIQQAIRLLTGGNPDSSVSEQNIRESMQAANAQAVGDARAQLGAAGFGASGVAGNLEAGILSRGAREQSQAIEEARRRSREEGLRNILAGAGLSLNERQFGSNESMRDAVLRIIQSQMDQVDPGDTGPGRGEPGGETIIDDLNSASASLDNYLGGGNMSYVIQYLLGGSPLAGYNWWRRRGENAADAAKQSVEGASQ